MNLLDKLKRDATPYGLQFHKDTVFFWDPDKQTIHYNSEKINSHEGTCDLLHEYAHALLGHASYKHDLELLRLESQAWEKAQTIASAYSVTITEIHIQDRLDTYRDWLHKRSLCPQCDTTSLQVSPYEYSCHNCSRSWQVNEAKFCRTYRKTLIQQ